MASSENEKLGAIVIAKKIEGAPLNAAGNKGFKQGIAHMGKEKFQFIFKSAIIIFSSIVLISNGYAAEKFPIKPEALRNPSIFSGTGRDRLKEALILIHGAAEVEPLILSHSIEERWNIKEIKGNKIEAEVKFYSNGRLIGEANLQLTSVAASIMTCWFRSYQEGQHLGEEFATRIYLRSQQLSEWIGFNTQYAHMYFYLSYDEEQEGIDRIRLRYAAIIAEDNSIFRVMGLEEGKIGEDSGLTAGPYGDKYNEHIGLLAGAVDNVRTRWITLFYRDRIKAILGEDALESFGDSHDYEGITELIGTNLKQNGAALRRIFDAAVILQSRYASVRERLSRVRQEHLLKMWAALDDKGKEALLDDIERSYPDEAKAGKIGYYRALEVVDVGGQELIVIAEEKINVDLIKPEKIIIPDEEENTRVSNIADEALRLGKVGLITVGGGMSSRAGIDYPKGATPIAPISKKTLYQCMAEELLAARVYFGKVVPWYIMTSEAMGNDEATRAYFKKNRYFGLGEENVVFIRQENVGALEADTRKIAMSGEGKKLTTPNGHGGIYKAMRDSNARSDGGKISALDNARTRGIDTFLFVQVDNPLPIINRTFLGLHLAKGADYTIALVEKRDPKEGLGMIAIDTITGRKFYIEYNQPAAVIVRDREDFGYGSIKRNIFSISFLSAVEDPPFHMARGKKAMIYKDGSVRRGDIDKFERFVFDNLVLARRAICVGLPREECFAAFKEMTGPDSPEAVGRALSNYNKMIIARALQGVMIPETTMVELPRIAHFLTPEELAEKLNALNFKDFIKEGTMILVSDDFKAIHHFDVGKELLQLPSETRDML